jgi:ABC-type multidrug transport system ATPase subunit
LADPRAIRRQLGYLPQDFGVYPRIPAKDLLEHLAVLKGVSDRRERAQQVAALLELTNLYDVRNRAVSTFSGGMRQRFGIAQALLGHPRLIIVDEPTAGLDPAERNRFLNLLGSIAEDVIVILSTHIVDDVRELCTRMAIINEGKVLLESAPEDAIATLAGRMWKKSIARDELAGCQQRLTVVSTSLVGGRTMIRVLADARPDEAFAPAEPNLEDVYFTTIGSQAA